MEQPDAIEELPPFSFSKKPITAGSGPPASSISANILKSMGSDCRPTASTCSNNINYDEQIRAPRMSVANYTYKPEPPRPFTHSTAADVPGTPESKHSPKQESYESYSSYHPAVADLNTGTRRPSEPVRPRWIDTGSLLNPGSLLGPDPLLNPAPSFAHGDNDDEYPTLRAAVENLGGNVSTEGGSGSGTPRRVDGPSIQQVYGAKKPMGLPAVLRPTVDDERPENEREVPQAGLPYDVPEASADEGKVEPTHEHWKPDKFSDHCMNCFETFGFFYPQRRRRHHCRFCGLLYCHSCMYKNRETCSFEISRPPSSAKSEGSRANSGVSASSVVSAASLASDDGDSGIMLDAKARLVVPMFRNLAQLGISSQSLQDKFRVCKVCKTCGNNFSRLLHLLNQSRGDDISTPYVFIENPYLRSVEVSQPLYDLQAVSRQERPNRRQSSGNAMPSDWTWSSF